MYVEYIRINAACETNVPAIPLAALADSIPSISCSDCWVCGRSTRFAASSRAGRNISLWKEKSESRPLNAFLLSAAGMTVSSVELTPLRMFTGVTRAAAGLMLMSMSSCKPLTYVRSVLEGTQLDMLRCVNNLYILNNLLDNTHSPAAIILKLALFSISGSHTVCCRNASRLT